MRHSRMKRLSSFLMAVVMVLTLGLNSAFAEQRESGITVERLDPSDVTANLIGGTGVMDESSNDAFYADTDMVRVMIVLEGAPAISGVRTVGDKIVDNAQVAEQRALLIDLQRTMTDTISAALGGQELDVQWNLTLITNAISANVEYGQIETIKNIPGVKAVYPEVQYMPLTAETTNIVSQQMTGASAVQNTGYTGAGTRIAVIDTGTDTDHQSFSGTAFEYALAELAAKNDMSFDEYVATLNLLTVEEIAGVLDQLHIYTRLNGELKAEDLYINSKLPFNYNYVDMNTSMDHEDNGNEHGSHVAGISTANRYVDCAKIYDFDGSGAFDMDDVLAVFDFVKGGLAILNADYADLSCNGTITTYDVHLLLDALAAQEQNGTHFISALDSVRVTGVAPDAQLLTMKVFGASGGAYASDYMAAVEDSIVLGCDVVNLSLGAPYPGFSSSHTGEWDAFIDGIMARVAESGIVMSVAAGNSGNWADYSDNGMGFMYTDEAGTYTTSEPATYTHSLSVASADNVSSASSFEILFKGANGENIAVSPYYAVLDENYTMSNWVVLDKIDPNFAPTVYDMVFLGDPTALLTGKEQTDERIYAGNKTDFDGYDFTGKIVLVARGNGINFYDKHINAALAGAAGVVIYNNVPGPIQPNITGTTSKIPCLGISLEEAIALYNAFEQGKDGLYTGSLSVCKRLKLEYDESVKYPTMSSFSSWGTTGGLNIKPEITAPGGSIYSVSGLGTSGSNYTVMSGTSMAAPHLSGLTALLAQYIKENDLLEKTGLSSRVLAQSLLMSTAKPLIEEASGVEYSVRNQGAGLANIQNAINAHSYIMVKGQDDGKVKAELGDGTADRVVEFTITNFGDTALTYDLSASILTTGTVQDEYGFTYSANSMTALDAKVTFTEDSVTVPAGESVSVKATISISEETAAKMKELGYTNGFYIEGFLYINPVADSEGVVDASHSIPLLGWYGNWNAPSMYDSGDFFDYAYGTLERYSHIVTYTKNVLTWEPTGYGQGLYYTGNIYGEFTEDGVVGDQRYIEARNAISNLPTAQWNIYAIFPTLIRNVGDFKIEVTDVKTGEVYYCDDYEQYDDTMTASFFYANYGEWYDCTGEYGIGLGDWNFTDADGNPLPDGTTVEISLVCVSEYFVEDGKVDWDSIELTEGNKLSYQFTIDNTTPELIENSLKFNAETGELTFTVQDNNYIAAVVLLNGSASAALDFYYPDMDEEYRGNTVEGSLNLSDYVGKKVAIAVCDYAGNESYYAINLGGEGASYGQFIGFQPDPDGYPGSWVAFDSDVNKNETALFTGTADFVCAEYVNGHVYAQDETGKLYGIPYEALLADSVNLESYYITTLKYVYQDMAYNYVDGKLYALFSGEDEWGTITEVYTISMQDSYNDWGEFTPAYTEDEWSIISYPDLFALTMAIDDAGTIYILGMPTDWQTGELSETAHLFMATAQMSWGSIYYNLTDMGDTGLKMDFLQSMTWDHNTEALYWARFYPVSWFELESELVKFTFNEDGTFATETVGKLTNETCALIAPLSEEAAAKAEHQNVPAFDSSVFATPVLAVETMNLGKGQSTSLTCTFNPWYSEHTDVVWSSSDESVAVVDQNGIVTAVGDGVATITVANAEDETLFDTCSITVASLSLNIEGIISYSAGGINSVGQSKLYSYNMKDGIPSLEFGNLITAPDEFVGYGLTIGAAIHAKGSIWACEFGNAGLIYEIDPLNGMVKDMLSPIDGDMMFGFSYSEATGMFTGIMNFFLYVDQPLTHEAEQEMLDHMNAGNGLTWHKFNMLQYLEASQGSFSTGETGQGASSEIVFCGITDVDNTTGSFYNLYNDTFGNSITANYAPTTTHVILDNVGRLWHIDEITNMTYSYNEEWGEAQYTDEMGNMIGFSDMWGSPAVFNQPVYSIDADTELHNVFVIRDIEETPLTDMFRAGTMPRITYHFSDIYYAGTTAEGAPVYYLSLYDYWNEGSENLLYLYVGGVGTGQYGMDENWNYVEIKTEPMLFELGGTGTGNIVASILNATPADEIDGLPPIVFPEFDEGGWYSIPQNVATFHGCFRAKAPVVPQLPTISAEDKLNNIAACVNRLS